MLPSDDSALLDEIELDREAIRRFGFAEFIRTAWPHVPLNKDDYSHNWHVDAIADHLSAVSRLEIRDLIINIPPGLGKSIITSVMWPAWSWIEQPDLKWMFASFDASLSRRDALRTRDLLEDRWYQDRWSPGFDPKSPLAGCRVAQDKTRSAVEYNTQAGGFRFSTSVAGRATGRHVDIVVVDDPIKPRDTQGSMATTQAALRSCLDWWKGTIASRRANPATFRRVIIMQRLHKNDLAGAMIETGDYTHLCLPMEYTPKVQCPADIRTEPGELLHPDRFSADVVREMKRDMGPTVAAAQLQQAPNPPGGAIFKEKYIRHWKDDESIRNGFSGEGDLILPPLDEMTVLQSWDLTFKRSDGSDYVAGEVWAMHGANAFLLDLVWDRMSFSETCRALIDLSARWPHARAKIIEEAANGNSVVDHLKSTVPGLILVSPQGGKVARANAAEPIWASGNVHLPPKNDPRFPWVGDFIEQHIDFPRAVHDDMVDAGTQAIVYLQENNPAGFIAAMQQIRATG